MGTGKSSKPRDIDDSDLPPPLFPFPILFTLCTIFLILKKILSVLRGLLSRREFFP
jgi:hypothetical protein